MRLHDAAGPLSHAMTILVCASRIEREQQTGVIALTEHSPAAVRGVIEWMAAASGPPKQAVAARLLGPELVVETARLSHYLDVQPLLDSALRTVREASTTRLSHRLAIYIRDS